MTRIELIVTGATVQAKTEGVLTGGMVGVPVTIQYDSDWDGLTKTLVCKCGGIRPGGAGIVKSILNVENKATVAHEVMVPGRFLYLGMEGRNAEGTLVIPTVWALCGRIQDSVDVDGDPSTDPSPPVWAQLLEEIHALESYVESQAIQASWSQNDPTQLDHIKDRTHWTEEEVSEILPETVLTKDSDMGLFVLSEPLGLVDGGEYTVTWNGTEYVCKATEMTNEDGTNAMYLGNFGIFEGATDTGEPFLLIGAPADQVENLGFSALISADGDTATVSIIGGKVTIHKLDNKYLDLDWLPVYTDGDVVLEEQTVEVTTRLNDWYVGVASVPVIVPKTGQLLTVYINGIRYPAVVNHDNVDGTIIQAGDDQYANTMENLFLGNSIVRFPGSGYVVEFLAEVPGTYKIAIYLRDSVPMPETFLPDTIARVRDIPTADYINSLIDAKLATIPDASEVAY